MIKKTTGREVQLFIGNALPMVELFTPVNNKGGILCKPSGGLWTSTWDAETQLSDWLVWCLAEDFGHPEEMTKYLLTPDPSARIAVIDSFSDLAQLIQRYPSTGNYALKGDPCYIDYEAMSTNYDALHLTDKGQDATRYSTPCDLYGWDVESTLWFRWMFTSVSVHTKDKVAP